MKTKNEPKFKKDEILFHNKHSSAYDAVHRLDSLREKYVCGDFLKWLSKLNNDALVLEIGGGTGHTAIQVAERGYHIVTSDISPDMLRVSREKFQRQGLTNFVDFAVVDGEKLPFVKEYFDCVMIVAAFHHLLNPRKCLSEIHRCLKPGGYLIIGVEPNYNYRRWIHTLGSLKRAIISERLLRRKPPSYSGASPADEISTGFKKRELLSLLSESGFTVVESHNLLYLLAINDFISSIIGINLPAFMERAFMHADELIRRIPLIKEASRELSVLCQKR